MRMPTAARAWISAFLICLGLVLFPAYHHWFATRTWVAVDIPISLAPGRITTGDFYVHLRTVFHLRIDLKGYDENYWQYPDCQDYKVIQTRWQISRDGRVTSTWKDFWGSRWTGVPEGPVGGSYLGAFAGTTGRYNLDIEVASDASCLQRFHPHLRVYADDTDYAGGGWIFAAALLASLALVGTGAGFLLVSSAIPVAIEIPRGQSLAIFDTFRVQRASLRRRPTLMSPSSSPPTVGYLYAATCFLIFLAIAPLQLSIFRRDLGIPVRVIRPEVMMRPSGDQEITGLLVYVDRNDNLYLNSKPMTAAELPGALEDEFARRADWSVYVEGDPDLAYGTVIHAMDLVRGAHGKVILLTPGMRAEAEARHP